MSYGGTNKRVGLGWVQENSRCKSPQLEESMALSKGKYSNPEHSGQKRQCYEINTIQTSNGSVSIYLRAYYAPGTVLSMFRVGNKRDITRL